MKYIPYLFFILLTLSSSCKYQSVRERQKEIENSINYWNNKDTILPDTLLLLHDGQKSLISTEDILKSEIKIVSIISPDCRNCIISQLMFWDSFMMEYGDMNEFQLVLIYCGTDDYFSNVLVDELGIKLPILQDKSQLLLENKLFENPEFHTLLLDKENKIILLGDFSNNKDLEDLYLEEIEKRIE